MAKRRTSTGRTDPDRRFVQVADRPSLGVETSSGRAWVGVDQQVGHGSADSLFALTDEHYAAALVDPSAIRQLEGECWRGDHPELLLHRASSTSRPQGWVWHRTRAFPPRVAGEIWHHVDALGEAEVSERGALSRELAAGTTLATVGPDGVASWTFRLVGEGAYPRPASLIAGLAAGSDRERVRAVLGERVGKGEVHGLEGDRVRAEYADDGGLAALSLERPAARPLPTGALRPFLAVLGEPEQGSAFREVARLAGGAHRRWAISTGTGRRLLAFEHGVDVQVEHGRVLAVRVRLRGESAGARHPGTVGAAGTTGVTDLADVTDVAGTDEISPGATAPPSGADVRAALGAPVATSGAVDLFRYGTRDLLVTREGDAAVSLTAVLVGVSAPFTAHRWRSGEFALFLDVLGLPQTHPLVEHVRGLPGVTLRFGRDGVSAVEIGSRGHRTERFAAFVDGMPAQPSRTQIPIASPTYTGEHDDVRELGDGWLHVRSSDDGRVTSITLSQEEPRGLPAPRWVPHGAR